MADSRRRAPGRAHPSPPAGTDQQPGNVVCVLLVDDDRVDRMAVRRHLKQADASMEIAEATGVLEAIDRLLRGHFDCVLLDFNLPDGDGLTFLRGMRNAGFQVPVVILTGQSDPTITESLMLAGAAAYIPKDSLSPERLLQSIRVALRTQQ